MCGSRGGKEEDLGTHPSGANMAEFRKCVSSTEPFYTSIYHDCSIILCCWRKCPCRTQAICQSRSRAKRLWLLVV